MMTFYPDPLKYLTKQFKRFQFNSLLFEYSLTDLLFYSSRIKKGAYS